MKILVMSLLRIGDALMLDPLLRGIKNKYPHCQIDLLVNDSVAPHLSSMNNRDELIVFDRTAIQSSLGEPERPFFEGYSRVSGLVGKLNKNKYELVINLTQTRLSGWLMSLIEAKEKVGLELQTNGDTVFNSKWLSFLNKYDRTEIGNYFHYLDIFASALDIQLTPEPIDKNRDARLPIAIQAFTSDQKKNWEISEWVKALKSIRQNGIQNSFTFVCAPFELEEVNKIRSACALQGLETEVLQGSIQDVADFLEQCSALVSLDTSIKHLAVGRVPKVVELCFGSSNPYNTGVTQQGSLVLSKNTECGPCRHSSLCPYEQRSCAKVDAFFIGSLVAEYLGDSRGNLKLLAQESDKDLNISLSHRDSDGIWRLRPLKYQAHDLLFDEEINKRSWRFFLNNRHLDVIGEYGTEGLLCMEEFERQDVNFKSSFWNYRRERISQLKNGLKTITKSCELVHKAFLGMNREKNFEKNIWELVDTVADSEFVQKEYPEMVHGLQRIRTEPNQRFFSLRRMQMRLNDILAKETVRLKLLDSVYNQCRGEL